MPRGLSSSGCRSAIPMLSVGLAWPTSASISAIRASIIVFRLGRWMKRARPPSAPLSSHRASGAFLSVSKSASTAKLPAAIVYGCAGTVLTPEEREFFREADPFGFILFRRNCQTPDQVRVLVADLRDSVGRPDAPV